MVICIRQAARIVHYSDSQIIRTIKLINLKITDITRLKITDITRLKITDITRLKITDITGLKIQSLMSPD